MKPAVSVVIPLYNKDRYVERAVRSVLKQSLSNFELIVVDDGSTDNGAGVVSEIHDPRLRLLRQENLGPGAARNTGLSAAQAPIVGFLDADDEWLPDYLKEGLAAFDQYPTAAAVSQGFSMAQPYQTRQLRWEAHGLRDGLHLMDVHTDPQFAVHLLAYMSPCSTLARTACVRTHNGFYEQDHCLYGEDAYLWLRVLLNDPVVIRLQQSVIYHTEASELAYPIARPHPVEPFLLDPTPIERACPANKRELLRRILAIRAIKTARLYALHGQGSVSRDLLRRFVIPGFMTWQTLQIRALTRCAPILPSARAVYRRFKRRTRSEKSHGTIFNRHPAL